MPLQRLRAGEVAEEAWPLMRTELVGRERELAALVEHLESALAAAPRVVLCRGEPGIGKTRMAQELTGWPQRGASAAVLGERGRATGWIRRAAGEVVSRLAYEEGVRLYRLALDVDGGDLDRCQLVLALGAAQSLSGDHPGRLQNCRSAADLARSMARPDLIAETALILDGGDRAEADRLVRRLCEEVLRWLGPETTSLRARVAARLSGACIYLGDVDAAARASEQALAVASQCGDRAAVVATLRARQLVRGDPDGTEERCGLAAQMLEIGREASEPETQLWAHLWRIDVMFQRGELAGVGRELDHLAWCAGEVGGPVARWQLLRCRAAHAHAQARFDEAIRLANERIYSLFPALVLISAGRRAAAGLYRALGSAAEWQPIPHATTPVYALGIAARHLGLLDDAVADLDHARQVCVANGAAGFHLEALVELAVALARRAGPDSGTLPHTNSVH